MLLTAPTPIYGSLTARGNALTRDLVAHYANWPGASGSSRTWRDSAGRQHMTHVGGAAPGGNAGASWLPGSIRYSGSTPYTDAGQGIGAYLPSNAGTISVWARHENGASSGISEALADQLSGSDEFVFGLHYNNNNTYWGFVSPGQDNRVVVAASSTNWPQRTWVHYALTYASGGTTTVYVNGVSIGTYSPTTVVNPGVNLRFGYYYFATTYYAGMMADLRLWNRVLTARQVMDAYQQSRQLLSPLLAISPQAIIPGAVAAPGGSIVPQAMYYRRMAA